MTVGVMGVSLGLLAVSAALVSLWREPRAGAIAAWVNGCAAASVMLFFQSEILALFLAMNSTLVALAAFLNSDSMGLKSLESSRAVSVLHVRNWLSLLASAALGATVVGIFRSTMPIPFDGPAEVSANTLAGVSTEESHVGYQLIALLGLVASVGAAVIARPERREND